MASMAEIREGLAANMAALEATQVSSRSLSNPTPPYVYVVSGPIEYDKAMARGLDDVFMVIVALVAYTTDIGSYALLDEYMAPAGSRSIKEIAETDKTLGGLVSQIQVVSCTGERSYTFDTLTAGSQRPPMIGAEWTVRVLT